MLNRYEVDGRAREKVHEHEHASEKEHVRCAKAMAESLRLVQQVERGEDISTTSEELEARAHGAVATMLDGCCWHTTLAALATASRLRSVAASMRDDMDEAVAWHARALRFIGYLHAFSTGGRDEAHDQRADPRQVLASLAGVPGVQVVEVQGTKDMGAAFRAAAEAVGKKFDELKPSEPEEDPLAPLTTGAPP